MRRLERAGLIFAGATVTVLVFAGAVRPVCEARNLPPPSADNGYPGQLINRPACMTHPVLDDWWRCAVGDAQRQGAQP